ncbi:MAG TPA: amino acid ABC transporter substrate-binding protein [Dehalococcoidales bacterium]|nr:MAG: hypothetical protein A2Z05_01245 [Chloroflexi bacterium RBG_16_60_22]HJX13276.1 amino acid ABC transporter substrate-binding protein [Dehalococcoidales bacterium]
MKKIVLIAIAIILTVSIILTGCAKQAAAPAAGGKTEILFGAVNSLTGANVQTGADQKWTFEKAVADINAKGGIFVKDLNAKLPVKLIFEDDQSTPDGAAAAMEKLIKVHKVDLVLSSNNDKLNNAAATVADKYKMYYAGGGGWWGDDFLAQGFQYSSDMFFTAAGAAEVPFQVWDLQPVDQRPKRVAIMVMNIPDGAIFGEGVQAAAKKHGYEVVDLDAYTLGSKDFSSSILKMKSSNADSLLWLGTPPDSITLIRQMKAQNFNLKYTHGWMGFWPTEYAEALGADADFTVHDGFWAASLGYPGSEALDKAYRDSHNGQDSVSIGMYYAIVQVLAQAIENAGTLDSTAVRDATWNHTFKGTTMGDVTYNDKGFAETPSLALQWMEGKRMPVWPTGVSDYKLQWTPAWNAR